MNSKLYKGYSENKKSTQFSYARKYHVLNIVKIKDDSEFISWNNVSRQYIKLSK